MAYVCAAPKRGWFHLFLGNGFCFSMGKESGFRPKQNGFGFMGGGDCSIGGTEGRDCGGFSFRLQGSGSSCCLVVGLTIVSVLICKGHGRFDMMPAL